MNADFQKSELLDLNLTPNSRKKFERKHYFNLGHLDILL